MEEKILISIEIPKPEGEEEVDKLTRKITDLQIATANLQKQNNELIKQGKQNTDEYVENTRQIEINKQKITESVSARKGLVQTLLSEEGSIKALRIANANLIKTRDGITTATKEGREEIARLNKEIDANNEVIEENLDKAGKQKAAIGGYKDAIKDSIPFFRQGEQAFFALAGGAKVFTKALIATGIGLFVVALGTLIAYFKGSEEGQNKLNRVLAIGSAILEQFTNILEDAGEALVTAFENPEQAAKNFLKFLESQFVNRIVGIMQLIPELGRAVEQLFQGNFEEAATIAGDAIGKVALGIENASAKVIAFGTKIGDMAKEGIENGLLLAKLQEDINESERKLIVDRAKLNLQVQKLRADALEVEGEQRKKILLEAIALEEQLASQEVRFAELRKKEAQAKLDINGADIQAKKDLAQATADVFTAETTAFANSLRFKKEIAAIDEASAKEQAALLAEANKMLDDAEKLELDRQARIQEALIATEELRLEQAIVHADSIQERVDKEIELEVFKAFTLLENLALTEAEKQLIIEKSQANINAIILKGTQERIKKEDAEKDKAAKRDELRRNDNLRGIEASANAAVDFAQQAFGRSKGVAIAQATINTIMGVTRALSDYIFPYSLIVGALTAAAGAFQISKIASTKAARGMVLPGGILRGRSHAQGGIPFTVQGQGGFEAEGGEAIINKKSTRMFRPLLSKINEAGGGVAFARGGVTRFATGSIVSSQTRAASSTAESRTAVRDAVLLAMENMPPTIVTVEDINARTSEYAEQTNKALVA